jgi:hypothetical protein
MAIQFCKFQEAYLFRNIVVIVIRVFFLNLASKLALKNSLYVDNNNKLHNYKCLQR